MQYFDLFFFFNPNTLGSRTVECAVPEISVIAKLRPEM